MTIRDKALTIREEVVQAVNEMNRPVRAADIADYLGRDRHQVSGHISIAHRHGEIKRLDKGLYAPVGPTVVGTIPDSNGEELALGEPGDLYELVGTDHSGRQLVRQLETQVVSVITPLTA